MRYVRVREYHFNPRKPIDLLDPVAQRLAENRFTFTEADALQAIWEANEDIRLREDPRFYELEGLGHFHLTEQILANHLLIEQLWNGLWDGNDVTAELARLDQLKLGSFHVFCAADQRLIEENGRFMLTACPAVHLPDDLRVALDALTDRLLEVHRSIGAPATTIQLRDELLWLQGDLDFEDHDVDLLEAWLHSRAEWIEITCGLWLPAELVPKIEAPRVFQVLRVRGESQNSSFESVILSEQDDSSVLDTGDDMSLPANPPVERHPDASISWTHTLRTIYLNNAYLPVPVAARFRYPKLKGNEGIVAIRCVAHDSGREGWLWLDLKQHRFFGDLLREVIEWEEAGRKLRLHWQPEAIVIRLGEIDLAVHQEESRHIDPQALHELRLGLGESYRQALAAILCDHPQGLPFQALYEELLRRQQHSPSRRSIRTVLSQSSEFFCQEGYWRWRESTSSLKAFRRCLVLGMIAVQTQERKPGLSEVADFAESRIRNILEVLH